MGEPIEDYGEYVNAALAAAAEVPDASTVEGHITKILNPELND